jgi:putative PIN family toxin of toxin-antitoxin system
MSRKVYDYALRKGVIAYSKATLAELKVTFERSKFDKYIALEKRKDAIAYFEKIALHIEVTSTVNDCRDAKDNKFLELALDANADCIVTGDNDLLVLHPFRNIPILSAYEFIQAF